MKTFPFAICLVIAMTAHAEETRFDFSQPHMGTLFRIVLFAPDEKTAQAASSAAFKRIAELDQMMSDYRDSSELMQLCAKSGGDPVKVSPELFAILKQAKLLSEHSAGAFDVSVGPLVRLWRKARKAGKLPDKEAIEQAKSLVGYQNMLLNETCQTVQLLKKGMQLDLGAIAKGDASDKGLAVLKEHGITRALVAGGGDIALGSAPPGLAGWIVGIAPLKNPDTVPERYLVLHDCSVSTSGDAEQHLEIEGVRYSHIIDPRTGMGITGHCSVTTVAPFCRDSDSLGTAITVLGPQRGLELLESTAGAATLIAQEEGDHEKIFVSARWKDLPKSAVENLSTPNRKQ